MLTDVLAYVWVWVILKSLRDFKEKKVKTLNKKLFGALSSSKNKKLFGAGEMEAKPVCEKLSEKSRNNPPVDSKFLKFSDNLTTPDQIVKQFKSDL